MGYIRVNVRKKDREDKDDAYKRYYEKIDSVLAPYRIRNGPYENPAIDIRFFIREIAANFLEYEQHFNFADIDLRIESKNLDVTITVSHDGSDFDPLAPESKCIQIKAAAARMSQKKKPNRAVNGLSRQFDLTFNLKDWTNLGEEHVL